MTDLPSMATNETGAQPAPTGTTEAHGIGDITRVISAYFVDFDKSDSKRKLARADAETATDSTMGERERILRGIAKIAHKAAWSEDDTTEAVKKAIEQHAGNDKSKKSSLSTFASEIKLASGKRVRSHVDAMFVLAHEAWELEQLDPEAPQPLKKAFSRMYHVVVQGMMRAAKDGQPVPATYDELSTFATETLEARRVNYKRVQARLNGIVKELRGFYVDFAVDGIGQCLEYLEEVDENDLKAARERAEQTEPQDDDAPAQDEAEQEDEPQSASDLLDDALRDLSAAA